MTMDRYVLRCGHSGCRTTAVMAGVTNDVRTSQFLGRMVRRHFAQEGWTSYKRNPRSDDPVDLCPEHAPEARRGL